MVNSSVNEMVTHNNWEDEFFVDSFDVGYISTNENLAWYSIVNADGNKFKMKLNTGALANVISRKTFKKLKTSPLLQPTNVCPRTYGDHNINTCKINLTCTVLDQMDSYW